MQPDRETQDSLELLRMLRGLRARPSVPEPGFRSTQQWGVEWGMCKSKARRYINVALMHGLVTERTYMLPDAKGRLRVVPHYRFDKPAPPPA